MSRKQILFFIGLLILTSAININAGRYIDIKCKIEGYERTGKLYLPNGIKPQAPIVVCVHGYGGSANPKDYDLDPVADREGFAVLYPQGLKDSTGHTCFNVGYPMQKSMKVDDVKMLCKITQYVQKHYDLSRRNAFLTGMSNGGDICYLAAAEGQKTFAALAPIAGLSFRWSFEKYINTPPIPLFEVHGTEDRVSEWTGDLTNRYGWGAYMSVPIAVNYWVAVNHCSHEECDTIPSKDPKSKHFIIRHRYVEGVNGNEVWLYEVVGAPHCWHNQDINTGEEIWKFFSKYVK